MIRIQDAQQHSRESQRVEHVLAATADHAASAVVQSAACKAISNLARVHNHNRVTITRSGGIEGVLAAMTVHAESAEVQEQGCRALCDLARPNSSVTDNRVAIVQAGG